MSGLHAGVKFLSQLALALGMVLTMLVFIMDDSKFLLNLIVQEVGYYFQWSIFRKFSA
jgi:choline-glycine betaine transporter